MSISRQQICSLLFLVTTVEDDPLDCDGCLEQVAEFAERELAGRPLDEALERVRRHLHCCPCCQDEYQALLDALRGLQEQA